MGEYAAQALCNLKGVPCWYCEVVRACTVALACMVLQRHAAIPIVHDFDLHALSAESHHILLRMILSPAKDVARQLKSHKGRPRSHLEILTDMYRGSCSSNVLVRRTCFAGLSSQKR